MEDASKTEGQLFELYQNDWAAVGQPTGFYLLSLCDTIPSGIKDFVTNWDPSSWYLYSYDGNLLGLVIHLYDHFFFQNINDQPEMEEEASPSPQEQQKWPGGASGNLLVCPTYPPWNKYQMLMDFYLCWCINMLLKNQQNWNENKGTHTALNARCELGLNKETDLSEIKGVIW